MRNFNQYCRLALALGVALSAVLTASRSEAFPAGRVTFQNDAPFTTAYGPQTLTSTDGNLTVAAWADTNATVPAALFQWWILLGIDSGVGNGALIDGNECMTLQFGKSVGAGLIQFVYTGGTGGATNNLARISISGFSSDPRAIAVTANTPRISHITYTNGTVAFDYLDDAANDYGLLMFANAAASAGATLKITGAVSPNGDATSWTAALYRVDVEEAYPGLRFRPTAVTSNKTNTYVTADGLLTIKGYTDASATTLGNFGAYADECFGLARDNAVRATNTVTLQFAASVGLSRLDSVYSSGTALISGFTSDPGFLDPSGSSFGASYADGTLVFAFQNSGLCSFYFTNRAASAGQIIKINMTENQFGIAGVGYATLQTLTGPDIPSNVSPTFTTPDGLLTLTGYSDTPGTVQANLFESGDWFGVSGGNNSQSVDGAESLTAHFAAGVGLSGIGTRYSSGPIIISGFTSDPGFNDPTGTATGVAYSNGTLSYTFNAPNSPEIVARFTNPFASAGQTLTLRTDGSAGAQLTLTRLVYSASSAPVTLSIARSGNNIVLSWPTGTLQQSTNVVTGYADMTGITSPYTNSIQSLKQNFFRVKVQ